jgi:hypothetical protein
MAARNRARRRKIGIRRLAPARAQGRSEALAEARLLVWPGSGLVGSFEHGDVAGAFVDEAGDAPTRTGGEPRDLVT